MKKAIALLLVLALGLMAFAGCKPAAPAATDPSDTNVAADPADPADPADGPAATGGFSWNGKKEVWSVLPTTAAEGLVIINDTMGASLEAQGWTYVKKDAEGNPGNQVTFIEDAIAAGNVGALMVAAMSVDMIKDACEAAIDAGIIVVFLGAKPNGYAINGCVYTAYELTGLYAIEMVEEWAKQNNPPADDKGIPVALDCYDDIEDGQYRSNAFRDRTEASEILYTYNITQTYGDDAINGGYSWAENMMAANPDLRIFVCYEPECMVGVVSYLNQYCDENNIDKAEFCVVCCYEDSATLEEFDKTTADPSSTVFKGFVTYGDGLEATGKALGTIIAGSADGSWPFTQIYYDSVHSRNNFGYVGEWVMGDENPAEIYKY